VAACYSKVKWSRKLKPLPYAGQGDTGKHMYIKEKDRNMDK
jgi:hypothetical protein